ncbi:Fatty acid hydroxylase superfamily protein [Pirellula sp. SH-Sr6A]|uniref:sterol desaturase family protein n=1 Tax=Pirellula sp. SH-Sr6A TaxID=1632865 RepID=UPI00078CD956|nr:sterol desaturase family protein [Pirellula sp. SH-Sr6A]AMV30677.1 Fatty acid hydroxylase superfamily protein [Pirellula sp. SH-Sr6A]
MIDPLPDATSSDQVTTHSRVDGEPVRWGTGWISGVLGITLGIFGFGAVVCMRFPDWLTMPALRELYPLPVLRVLLQAVLVVGFGLGIISLSLRKKPILGGIACALAMMAALLGGAQVPIGQNTTPEGPFFGLDWFLLNLFVWTTIFIPLERMFALRAEQPIFRHGWRTDLSYFLVSAVLIQWTTIATLKPAETLFAWTVDMEWRRWIGSQPIILQILAILLITDFVQYWVHRAFHRIPWLWRFHSIHHSAEAMDWLAGSRLHIVDVLVTRSLTYIPLFALGFSEWALVIYAVLVSVQATMIHANLRFLFGPLRYFFVTPQFHHWHHSDESEGIDKNFAVHLPVWDFLFGSFFLPGNRWPRSYGVHGEKLPEGFVRQLAVPFRRAINDPMRSSRRNSEDE